MSTPCRPAVALLILLLASAARADDTADPAEIPWGGTQNIAPGVNLKRPFHRYPKTATKHKIGAAIIVKVLVRRDGSAESVELLGCRAWKWGKLPNAKQEKHCAALYEEIAEMVQWWTYRPALLEGRPVDAYHAERFHYTKTSGEGPDSVWTEAELEKMIPVVADVAARSDSPRATERPPAALPPDEPWIELRASNFTVFTSNSEHTARSVARQFETLRAVLGALHGDRTVRSPRPTLVYLFRDEVRFAPYTVGSNVGGYFIPSYEGNFIGLYSGASLGRTIFHEYLHYFVANNLPNAPLWFNEGLAELYETFEVSEREAELGRFVRPHLELLRREELIPLDELFAVGPDSGLYNESDRRGVFYAQSWALVHYLVLGQPEAAPRIAVFLEQLSAGRDPGGALQAALGVSLGELQGRLAEYIDAGTYPSIRISFSELEVSDAGVARELSRAEALSRLGLLLVHADAHMPESAAGHFRAALALEPELAVAHSGLGATLALLGDREGALAALAQAEKLAPEDDHVLLTRSKLLLDDLMRTSEDQNYDATRLAEVGRLARAAIEQNPDRADAYRLLGYVLALDRDCDEGPNVLKKAWQMSPSDVDSATSLAHLLGRCGEIESANFILESFLAEHADEEVLLEVRSAIAAAELQRIEELATQGSVAEALDRLRALRDRVDDPELLALIDNLLEHAPTELGD
ncbi:MAG: hypothetical protein GY716_10240 [bacterium]|nr:hypothetical protein [bacterium]